MISTTTLLIILFGFTIVGILLGRMSSAKTKDDFALGGRSMGLFPSLMTLSGTFVSAVTLMVYTAFVYKFGISAVWIFIGYILGFLLFIPFAVKLYRLSVQHQFFTMTDYFVFRYGRKTARIIIGVVFLWYVGLLSTQFLAGSNLLNELGGIPVAIAKVTMLLVVLTYLLVGGFGSVVKTDVFQFIVIFLVLFLVGMTVQRGADIPKEMYDPFNAGPDMIAAFLILGILTPFATQDYWQKVFAMKNEQVVKRSFSLGAVMIILITLPLTYVGLIARANFPPEIPEYANGGAELMVLHTFTDLVPPEFQLFVLIAFFAAILSTSDTYLFLLALNVTNDLFPTEKKSEKQEVNRIRKALIVVGILALLIALFFLHIEDIVVAFKALGIGIAPVIFYDWAGRRDKRSVTVALVTTAIVTMTVSTYMLLQHGQVDPGLGFVSVGVCSLTYFFTYQWGKKKKSLS